MKKLHVCVIALAASAGLYACAANGTNTSTAIQDTAKSSQSESTGSVMEGTMAGTTAVMESTSEETESTQQVVEEHVASEGESLAATQMDNYFVPFMYQAMRNDWEGDFAKRNNYELANGYHHLGKAFFNDFFGNPQSAYIPYGGIINLIEGMVSGNNHGVYIANGVIQSSDAISIAEELKEAVEESGFSIITGKIATSNNGQTAYFPFYYEEIYEGVSYKHFGIRYASMGKDGEYLFSEIIFTPLQFDASTNDLIAEIKDVLKIDFIEIKEGNENAWIEMTK